MHKNLDLDNYDEYMGHFWKYSYEWVDFESVFDQNLKKSK